MEPVRAGNSSADVASPRIKCMSMQAKPLSQTLSNGWSYASRAGIGSVCKTLI